jgi:NodT family efflux transporter outer membrane factor (OMF) lipoprotein
LPHGGKVDNLLQWWAQWNDSLLTQLIQQAEQHNPTLDMAVAKLSEARANAGISDAASLPSLSANASATRSKSLFGNQLIAATVDSVRFDALWEIDLFGRVRRGQEAAQARMQSSMAGWHQARISLAGEVAGAYVEFRACQAGVTLAEKMLISRRSTSALIELKRVAGFASLADLARTQADCENASAALAAKQGDCTRQLNRLVAVTGLEYGNLQKQLQAPAQAIPVPQQINLETVAANALSQRPDVAAVEAEWAAASADIGVTKANLFPSLNLAGSIGVSRLISSGLSTNASTWSFGPTLNLPIFNGGKNSEQVKAATARFDYAQANYQKTIRAAVQEIEDALVRLNVATQRIEQNRASLAHYQTILQAGNQRRQAGMANQLEVEEALRTAWLAEDTLQTSQRDSALAWVGLYKVLGGSWEPVSR